MTLLTTEARGVYVIAVTPFHPDGRIDMESCDRMVDFYLAAGATGLTVLGMLGEAPTLTVEESRDVVARILARVAGRVPVVVGVSAPGFAQIDTLTRMVMDLGAAGVMVAPPGSLRTDDQIVTYFRQAADVLGDVPFVLQDFPLATCVQMSNGVIARIMNDLPTCVCLKHEDWPGLEKITALRRAAQDANRLAAVNREAHDGAAHQRANRRFTRRRELARDERAAGDLGHVARGDLFGRERDHRGARRRGRSRG